MKKFLLLFLTLLLVITVFCACGNEETGDPSDTTPATDPAQTEEPQNPNAFKLPEGVTVSHKFEAPTQDPTKYRQVVRDYMYAMYDYKWTPAENIHITWKNKGDFGVDLTYSKGKTYYGVPYSNTKAPLCEFDRLVVDGKYKYSTYYYEETIGNHCSSSMGLAYQQLINLPYSGSLKPNPAREGLLQFPIDLQTPEGTWYSKTLFTLNGKDKIFEAYAALDMGDILYKNIESSGHTRMVDKVTLAKNANGSVNYARSYIETIEQTNAFDSTRKDGVNTTWWIDHKYTFDQLYNTLFMPVSLCVFHTGAPIDDAYIWLEGTVPTADTLVSTGLIYTVNSNFPLAFTNVTITNEKGENVRNIFHYNFDKNYSDSFRKELLSLKLNELPAGKYTYKLDAGIARGCCTLQEFEFTVK